MRRLLRQPRARRAPARAGSAPPWEDVLAAFNDAVIVLDRERRVVFFNPAAEELVGLPQKRVLGEPCERVFADTPALREMVDRVQAHGQTESHIEDHIVCRRRRIPVRMSCLPLWDERDRVSGTALVIHDIGYQQTLEEAARRNESLARLGAMVAGLAHEIRNPLAGMNGAAQLLAARLAGQPELAEYTAVITREASRLSALVEDLLTLGSPAKPRLVPLNIHRVVQQVVAVAGPEFNRRGIRFRFRFDPSLPDVLGDAAKLSQVFMNLLRNAGEAVTAGGAPEPGRDTITIATRMETDFHILRGRDQASKFLRVEVIDRGAGIDPEAAEQMFEPFFTTKARGTGLGLAISHKIVLEHGGIIRAASNPSTGTVMTVTLPVARG